MTLQAGSRVGPYEILAKLGEGGMGEVYRARDHNLGRDVALKVLPEAFITDSERIARFQREAQLLAAIHHPHIASVFGLETTGAAKVLAMELVEGESLADRLKKGRLPLDEAVPIARQIAEALAAAHDKGIVHRDLKPANIMLTGDGRVKVLDFGLAKMLETEVAPSGLSLSPTLSIQATMAGTILGTAAYMSPEQARGRNVDKRTDVWAFGCVLFEMLAGKRAFEGEDATDVIAAVVRAEPEWTALPADLPRPITRAIRGCLAKDQKLRFGDVAVALFLLTDEAGTPTAAAAPPAAAPPAWWKRALPVGLSIALTATLVGSVTWAVRPAPPAAVVGRFSVPLPEDLVFTNTGRRMLAVSPDGSSFAYVANRRLYLRTLADPEAHAIPGAEGAQSGLTNPVFSPDGRQLAFYSNDDSAVKRIWIAGGTPVTVCAATNPLGMVWDERGILFAQSGKGILRVSPNGGVPEVVVAIGADEMAASPQLLPDNRGVLFSLKKSTDSWEDAQIVVHSPGGTRTTVMKGAADGRYIAPGRLLYAQSGVVLAVGFDLRRLATSGAPVPLIEGVGRTDVNTPTSGAAQFDIADNGTLVFVPGPAKANSGEGDRLLAIFDGKGGIERLPVPVGSYRAPRVSPDGRTVAFEATAEPNVYLYTLAGGTAPRRLTFGGQNRAPIWSPDGQWVAFESDREKDTAVFRQRADGSGVAERLTRPEGNSRHTPQAWSPDGAHMLVMVEKDGAFELDVLTLADRKMTPFGDVRGMQPTEAVFSPDGRWVLYQTDAGPLRRQAFVQPFPATGAKYLVPIENAGHPFWIARDNRLVFNTNTNENQSVTIQTTPAVTFSPPVKSDRRARTEPNPRAGRRNVDALPDGRLLGVTLDVGTAANNSNRGFMVVVNWFTELNARVQR